MDSTYFDFLELLVHDDVHALCPWHDFLSAGDVVAGELGDVGHFAPVHATVKVQPRGVQHDALGLATEAAESHAAKTRSQHGDFHDHKPTTPEWPFVVLGGLEKKWLGHVVEFICHP